MGQILGKENLVVPDIKKGFYWGPKSCLRSSPAVFRIFEHQGVHLDKNGIYQTVAKALLNP